MSNASNLVDGDFNQVADDFVHDLQTRKTERVSIASDGSEGRPFASLTCTTDGRAISSNGRYVAFTSAASNLIPNDRGQGGLSNDAYVHNRRTGTDMVAGGPIIGNPTIVYGARFSVADRKYELRIQGSPGGGRFGLFDCTEACTEVSKLDGGYGTVGEALVAAIPLDTVGLRRGGACRI